MTKLLLANAHLFPVTAQHGLYTLILYKVSLKIIFYSTQQLWLYLS